MKQRRYILKHLSLILFLLFMVEGCKVERPKEIISPSKMEDILYDYHLAQVMGSDLSGENLYKRSLILQYVYDKHHITRAELDSSLVWYARNPKALSQIYEHLEARADAELELIKIRKEAAERKGPMPVEGDSAELWFDNHLFLLTATPYSNRVSYTIPVDSNFHPRDILEWTFNVRFIPKNSVLHKIRDIEHDDIHLLGTHIADSLSCEATATDSTIIADSLICTDIVPDSTVVTDSMACDTYIDGTMAGRHPFYRAKAVATLLIRCTNDSVVAVDRVITDNSSVRITVQNSDSIRIKHIYFNCYFKSLNPTDQLVVYSNSLKRYRYPTPTKVETVRPDTLTTTRNARSASSRAKGARKKRPSTDSISTSSAQ